MTRLPYWQVRLTDWLTATARLPFRPGRHDCALFAAGAVRAMTGVDMARGFRGYRTLAEGKRFLRAKGFGDHIALAASVFPISTTPHPGDLAVVATPDGPALGVVQGRAVYVVAPVGWSLAPLDAAVQFFEV